MKKLYLLSGTVRIPLPLRAHCRAMGLFVFFALMRAGSLCALCGILICITK